jgi:general stress protein 26
MTSLPSNSLARLTLRALTTGEPVNVPEDSIAMNTPTSAGSLSGASLTAEALAVLLRDQQQCVVSFHDASGWPRGVVMSFLFARERFWLSAVEGRMHVEGLRNDPRLSVVVNNLGTDTVGRQMIAQRGHAVLHQDRETLEWFYPLFAARLVPHAPQPFARHLDTPNRVVIEVVPEGRPLTHDSRRLAGDGRGGAEERGGAGDPGAPGA